MSLTGLLERSGVSFDLERLNKRMKTSKLDSLQCVEAEAVSTALARAQGHYKSTD